MLIFRWGQAVVLMVRRQAVLMRCGGPALRKTFKQNSKKVSLHYFGSTEAACLLHLTDQWLNVFVCP